MSTDADRKLIELTALGSLPKRATEAVTGSHRQGMAESRRKVEAKIEEALGIFAAYDDLAKRDVLTELEVRFLFRTAIFFRTPINSVSIASIARSHC